MERKKQKRKSKVKRDIKQTTKQETQQIQRVNIRIGSDEIKRKKKRRQAVRKVQQIQAIQPLPTIQRQTLVTPTISITSPQTFQPRQSFIEPNYPTVKQNLYLAPQTIAPVQREQVAPIQRSILREAAETRAQPPPAPAPAPAPVLLNGRMLREEARKSAADAAIKRQKNYSDLLRSNEKNATAPQILASKPIEPEAKLLKSDLISKQFKNLQSQEEQEGEEEAGPSSSTVNLNIEPSAPEPIKKPIPTLRIINNLHKKNLEEEKEKLRLSRIDTMEKLRFLANKPLPNTSNISHEIAEETQQFNREPLIPLRKEKEEEEISYMEENFPALYTNVKGKRLMLRGQALVKSFFENYYTGTKSSTNLNDIIDKFILANSSIQKLYNKKNKTSEDRRRIIELEQQIRGLLTDREINYFNQ